MSVPIGDPDSEAGNGLIVLAAGPEAGGMRLDQWLAGALGADYSRNRVQGLIRQGAVRVDGVPASEPRYKMAAGMAVSVDRPEPDPAQPEGEDIALVVLHEDADLIVIDKPAGLVVHPGAGNWTGTLVNALIHHCGATLSGIGGVKRPGIVHRLDKETTGVMVVAKTDRAHRLLSEAFADHGLSGDLERAYVALVWGTPKRPAGVIDAAIGRAADRTRRAVVPDGRSDARHAVTRYTVLERFGEKPDATAIASLVECRLETGRTHQIRVHMAHIGHPLVSDLLYAPGFATKINKLPNELAEIIRTLGRQALHAAELGFEHPKTGEEMMFEAELPVDLQRLEDALEPFNRAIAR